MLLNNYCKTATEMYTSSSAKWNCFITMKYHKIFVVAQCTCTYPILSKGLNGEGICFCSSRSHFLNKHTQKFSLVFIRRFISQSAKNKPNSYYFSRNFHYNYPHLFACTRKLFVYFIISRKQRQRFFFHIRIFNVYPQRWNFFGNMGKTDANNNSSSTNSQIYPRPKMK